MERRERRERLCARVRERRSVARRAAVTSGEGGSPKMKNFMNAPRIRTIEIWPRRRPWVKDREDSVLTGGMFDVDILKELYHRKMICEEMLYILEAHCAAHNCGGLVKSDVNLMMF